jgi:hypothetical protein
MDEACSKYGEWRYAYRLLVGKPARRENVKDVGVGGRIMLKWIIRKLDGAMDRIYLAEERERWRVVVNAVMKCKVP